MRKFVKGGPPLYKLRHARPSVVRRAFCSGALLAVVCLLAACSPHMSEPVAGGDSEEPAAPVEWSMEVDCATCHTTEGESSADANCLASQHASQNCITCHVDQEAMTEVHAAQGTSDKMPKKLKKTAVDNEVCLGCHGGTLENFVSETSDVPPVVDENGTETNPHQAVAAEHHFKDGEMQVACSGCHSMHKAESAEDMSYRACITCHHAGVFECYTCHE